MSKLAKNVLISLGMANAILKKAISKGYVEVKVHIQKICLLFDKKRFFRKIKFSSRIFEFTKFF